MALHPSLHSLPQLQTLNSQSKIHLASRS
jgi:hypothetical protein